MACRYSIEERRKIAAWMEVFQSPRIVQERFRAWTGRDAPSRLTIGRIYEKFVRTGSVQDDCKGNSGRKRSVRTEENIINVQGAMVASPTKSTRRLARETKISRRSLIRILHYDLGMKPYHLQVVQQLTDADKQARVNAAHILLEMVHMEPDILFMFSDEATFHISGRVNKHNCVIWATEHPKEVREHMRDSAKVNVWCAVSKYGVIGPFFFNEQTVRGENYVAMLSTFMEENVPVAIIQRGYFQQDGAPAHYSLMVRDYLNNTFGRRWIGRGGPLPWPARSPDLTPCDFWLWGMVKDRVYASKPHDMDDLKNRITQVIAGIPPLMAQKALKSTMDRLHMCIERDGCQIETL